MQSQELFRSQMPGSRMFATSALPRPTDPLQRRVVDLEEQVKFLQAENERAVSPKACDSDRLLLELILLCLPALTSAKIPRSI